VNSADFIFFSSTTGFFSSFFLETESGLLLELLGCMMEVVFDLDLSSSASASPPQTYFLFVTRSWRLSLVSAEVCVTLTGAKPEVLSTGAATVVLTSLDLLKIGYSCLYAL
jgi:hypothetical protein